MIPLLKVRFLYPLPQGSDHRGSENRFQATGNNARYRTLEMDALVERYVTAVPRPERMQALADIVRHRTENLPSLGLFYDIDITIAANAIQQVAPRSRGSTQAWNVDEWGFVRS